jgi:ABC-2 type transport system permease protein
MARCDQKIQRGGGMMRYLTILKASIKLNLQTDLAYRSDAAFGIGMAIFWIVYELAAVGIIFSNTQSIGGWGVGEVIALTGVWKVMNTFMFAWIYPNTEKFNVGVRDGTLDYLFLQPVNSQVMVSINRFVLWRLVEMLLAVGMVVAGLAMSSAFVTVGSIFAFIVLTISGIAVIYSVWILLISLTFWFTKFDNSVTLLSAFMDSGRFPSTVYPAWLRALITFVIPIAIATSVPLQALRGEFALWQVFGFLAISAALFLFAAFVWRTGSAKYTGASS